MTAAVWDDQPELGGFDESAREIINTAIRDGWTARRSRKGHMIMRAPDGKTTTSISRDLGSKRRERNNAWAPIRRYQKLHGLAETPMEGVQCDQCDYVAADNRSLGGHKAMNHGTTRVCEYGCGREFHTNASYALHIKSHVRKIEAEQKLLEIEDAMTRPDTPEPAPVPEKETTTKLYLAPAAPAVPAVPDVPVPAVEPPLPLEDRLHRVKTTELEPAPKVADHRELDTETLVKRINEGLEATQKLASILEAINEVPALMAELTRRHGEMEASLSLMGELFDSIRGGK